MADHFCKADDGEFIDISEGRNAGFAEAASSDADEAGVGA